MTVQEFINKVEEISPIKETYFQNKNRIMPQVIADSYIIKERDSTKDNFNQKNDIIRDLIEKFQSEKITFGDYSFVKNEITQKGDLNIFCYSSHSFLAYKNASSEIIEYDNDSNNLNILEYCAKDSVSFLQATLCLLEMYALRLQGSIHRNDMEKNSIFLDKCITKAGGQKYTGFFKSIIF